jgi:adenylosuccinate synthase
MLSGKRCYAIDDDEGDVLSGFETLKVCTDYNYKGEK